MRYRIILEQQELENLARLEREVTANTYKELANATVAFINHVEVLYDRDVIRIVKLED